MCVLASNQPSQPQIVLLVSHQPSQASKLAYQASNPLSGLKSALLDLRSALLALKSVLSGLKSALHSHSHLRPKLALKASNQPQISLKLTSKLTISGLISTLLKIRLPIGKDGRMDERKSPCVLQDFIFFGAAAQLPLSPIHNHAKQGNWYRWAHIALGRPVYHCSCPWLIFGLVSGHVSFSHIFSYFLSYIFSYFLSYIFSYIFSFSLPFFHSFIHSFFLSFILFFVLGYFQAAIFLVIISILLCSRELRAAFIPYWDTFFMAPNWLLHCLSRVVALTWDEISFCLCISTSACRFIYLVLISLSLFLGA